MGWAPSSCWGWIRALQAPHAQGCSTSTLSGPLMRSCNRAEELGFHNAHQALLGNKESWLKAKFYFLKCVKNGLVTARSPPPCLKLVLSAYPRDAEAAQRFRPRRLKFAPSQHPAKRAGLPPGGVRHLAASNPSCSLSEVRTCRAPARLPRGKVLILTALGV